MRKFLAVFALVTLVAGVSAPLLAADDTTVKGEVIDLQCHAKQGEKATGESHADCAMSCAKKGAPLAILTSDGTVYTITGDYSKDKNKKLIPFVAKQVEAKGEVTEKDGKKEINVTSMTAAS
jgi:hypothetical protein